MLAVGAASESAMVLRAICMWMVAGTKEASRTHAKPSRAASQAMPAVHQGKVSRADGMTNLRMHHTTDLPARPSGKQGQAAATTYYYFFGRYDFSTLNIVVAEFRLVMVRVQQCTWCRTPAWSRTHLLFLARDGASRFAAAFAGPCSVVELRSTSVARP